MRGPALAGASRAARVIEMSAIFKAAFLSMGLLLAGAAGASAQSCNEDIGQLQQKRQSHIDSAPIAAAQPINPPHAKASPRTACGQNVKRLANG